MCEECFWKTNSASLQLQFVFSSSHLCVLLFLFKTHQWLHSLHNDKKKGFLDLVGSSDDHLTAQFSQKDSQLDRWIYFISSDFFLPLLCEDIQLVFARNSDSVSHFYVILHSVQY